MKTIYYVFMFDNCVVCVCVFIAFLATDVSVVYVGEKNTTLVHKRMEFIIIENIINDIEILILYAYIVIYLVCRLYYLVICCYYFTLKRKWNY